LVHEPVMVRRLCLYVDRFNPPYAGLIRNVVEKCREVGIEPYAAPSCADHLATFGLDEGGKCDMGMVIGGDGTILRGLGYFLDHNVPVLGLNSGNLGFLAGAEQGDAGRVVERIAGGEYVVGTIPVLRGTMSSGKVLRAVNDFSVNRSMMGGILYFEIFVEGERIAGVAGDGVVISTPMGSTAYSLSCGGPILAPGLPAMLVVSICPHSLSLRPLVVPDESVVSIKIGRLRSTGPVVSVDGAPSGSLKAGESLEVTRDSGSCMLVRFDDEPGYYSRLSLKLGWGARG